LIKRFSFTAALALGLLVCGVKAQTKTPGNADADCLACHGQKDLKSASGHSVFVDEAKHKASAHSVLGCTDCHTDIKGFPHPAKIAEVSCATCHADEAADVPNSVHSLLGADACWSCHGAAHYVQPAAGRMPQLCTQCHSDEVKQYLSSVHGVAAQHANTLSTSCQGCHGPVHKILAATDANSRVAKKNLPDTCGSCHSNPEFLAKYQIPFAHPVEAYKLSVHGRAVAAGNEKAATCSDCHGSHAIYAARDTRSKVNHWKVPSTCGVCHSAIAKTYGESVHGQALARGSTDAPTCTDCHGEHVILAPSEAQSLVNPARVSSVTCGRCHGDERIDARYNMPADRVPTYADSYHGLALRGGSQTIANCASCHGVHNIFPSSDPRSTINPANLAHTCGACHPGAGQRFAIGPVHVRPETRAEHPVVRVIRRFYWVTIPLAVAFMFLHHLMDLIRKSFQRGRFISAEEAAYRLNKHFRVAHWLTLISFPVLVITGFALKFPDSWWGRPWRQWEGRYALRGTIHRVAACVLLASLFYHIVHLIIDKRARRLMANMMPKLQDMRDLQDMISYNLGVSAWRPVLGEFNYVQKVEYLAFLWGTVVMAASGLILWFNTLALRYFPKWVLDAATALHYYEAILATFAILIWHMYSVVFDPEVYPLDRVRRVHARPTYVEEPAEEPTWDSKEKDVAGSDAGTERANGEEPGSSGHSEK